MPDDLTRAVEALSVEQVEMRTLQAEMRTLLTEQNATMRQLIASSDDKSAMAKALADLISGQIT